MPAHFSNVFPGFIARILLLPNVLVDGSLWSFPYFKSYTLLSRLRITTAFLLKPGLFLVGE